MAPSYSNRSFRGIVWASYPNGSLVSIVRTDPWSLSLFIGALARDWRALAIGLLMGIGITFLHAWLSDKFLDPWIARFQRPLQNGLPRILANIVAFAWAFTLSALSMLAPITVS